MTYSNACPAHVSYRGEGVMRLSRQSAQLISGRFESRIPANLEVKWGFSNRTDLWLDQVSFFVILSNCFCDVVHSSEVVLKYLASSRQHYLFFYPFYTIRRRNINILPLCINSNKLKQLIGR